MKSDAPDDTPRRADPRRMLSLSSRGSTSSAIRDLLSHARRDGVISLAGGLPAPDLFPTDKLSLAASGIVAKAANLQYGLTEGEMPLRSWIADHHSVFDRRTTSTDDVQVVSGSQQALDLIASVLVDPGDTVVVSEPEYLGAIGAFRKARADLVALPTDAAGINVDDLTRRMRAGLRPKICYVIPEFHNPTGATITTERLRRLADLADTYGFLIVEDSPYAALRFEGSAVPSLRTMTDNVVQCRTISKTLAPGLRVAWMVGPRWLLDAVRVAKQSADLHTSTVTQLLALSAIEDTTWYESHLLRIAEHYRDRRDALAVAIDDLLPGVTYDRPAGGMFVWTTFPNGTDTESLLPRALDAGVAFVPGPAFAVAGDLSASLRLSYATASPDQLREGVSRLASVMDGPTS